MKQLSPECAVEPLSSGLKLELCDISKIDTATLAKMRTDSSDEKDIDGAFATLA